MFAFENNLATKHHNRFDFERNTSLDYDDRNLNDSIGTTPSTSLNSLIQIANYPGDIMLGLVFPIHQYETKNFSCDCLQVCRISGSKNSNPNRNDFFLFFFQFFCSNER